MPATDYEKLAPFYDSLVTSDDDVAFFLDLSRQASSTGRVLELMAGTGRVSIPVASAGVALTCVDSSAAMLAELRRKLSSRNLTVEVGQQDVTSLHLDARFALAFIAFHSFEEITTEVDQEQLMRAVFAHLLPRGKFVCNLHDPEVRLRQVGPGRDQQWRFQSGGRQLQLTLSSRYEKDRSLVRGREIIHDLSSGAVIMDLEICFRLTSREEFEALAHQVGFQVEALNGDFIGGRYQVGESSSMVWVLVRPD